VNGTAAPVMKGRLLAPILIASLMAAPVGATSAESAGYHAVWPGIFRRSRPSATG